MATIEKDTFLWVEKYRPLNLSEVIAPEHVKKKFETWAAEGQIPHLLLGGSAGIGKTTLARAISHAINADVLYINASNENGVDVIRTKITQFASTMSLGGNLKVVLMDECLHEDEKVRVGTVDDWNPIALKDLDLNKVYPIVSFNMNTGALENDAGTIISMREDEVFEVELEDGRKIVSNGQHPFIVWSDQWCTFETIEMSKLQVGSLIQIIGGPASIKSITPLGKAKVRNLTVDKNHTFITENGIPTHNCDQLTHAAQGTLRATMEEFADNTRFVLTCNFKNKLMDAIHSRCTFVDFTASPEEKKKMIMQAWKRCVEILAIENVEADKKVVAHLVDKYFPDMRRVLNTLQQAAATGKVDSSALASALPVDSLYDAMRNKKWGDMRNWVAQNSDDPQGVIRSFFDELTTLFDGPTIPNVVIMLDAYQERLTRVADPELTLTSLCTEIMATAQWK